MPLAGPGRDHGGLTLRAKKPVWHDGALILKIKLYPGPWVHTIKAAIRGGKGQKRRGKELRKQVKCFASGVQQIRDEQSGATPPDVGGGRAEFRCDADNAKETHEGGFAERGVKKGASKDHDSVPVL